MTKFRHEIIVESSVDGESWIEYVWRYKPSEVTKRPPFWPVHMPALDWRCWFLHARGGEPPIWFMRVLVRLLECEPTVMDLFLKVPFDGVTTPKPQFIRAVLYDYRFAYKYELEDEMKRLVKEYHVRDTEIDTSSEEEIEVDEEKKVETPQAVPHKSPEVRKDLEPPAETVPREEKIHDTVDEKRTLRLRGKKDSALEEAEEHKAEAEQEPTAEEEEEEEEAEESPEEDEAHRRARETLERLLGIHLPAGPRRRHRRRAAPGRKIIRVRKVTKPVPQYDEAGRRIWYVRRHKIGAYGPTLTVKKPTNAEEEPEEWEGFVQE
jgi:hypothetical protein